MVVKYTKSGAPYLTPPYSAAEKAELYKGLNDTPTVVGHYHGPKKPAPTEKKEGPDAQ